MAENDTNVAGTGTGSAEAPRKQDLINNDWLAELALAEAVAKEVAKAAKVQGRADALLAEGVTQPFVDDLLLHLVGFRAGLQQARPAPFQSRSQKYHRRRADQIARRAAHA